MTVINTNVKSLVAQDAISKNNVALSTAMQRLSTGSRINSAKDDAAGLAISTRMTSQVRGLNMAVRNANDGISLMQTSEGALDEVTSILQRMRELAVQSVNGTNNNSDRTALNDEVTQLKSEIDRIAKTTQFNNQAVLDGSFAGKKLQIGDKSNQTMAVDIASVQTKDLGMKTGGMNNQTLISARVALGTAVNAGDIQINNQNLGAITANNDLGDIVQNINLNVDNVKASAFNTVVAKNIGDGITTNGQFNILVQNLGNTPGSYTTYAIKASGSLSELVSNINNQAGAQVTASINQDGKLVVSNSTGATIKIVDESNTSTSSYQTASGFAGGTTTTDAVAFAGFLQLDSKDGSPIRITKGNLGATAPGNDTEVSYLGFTSNTSKFAGGLDAYTVSGVALDATGMTTAWDQNALQINGTNIYNSTISTATFQGKLDAINNFSNQTGVVAYANIDKTYTLTADNLAGLDAAGTTIKINGVTAFSLAASATTTNVTDLASAINAVSTATGITATVSGLNIKFSGTNVTSMKIEGAAASGTAKTAGQIFTLSAATTFAGIRLDAVTNSPISISLGDNVTAGQIGLLEQNVGAADFQVNAPSIMGSAGTALGGLSIATQDSATSAISTIDNAIEKVSSIRSKLGAMENRLNNVVNNLTNISTNTSASRSRITDTDYATETTALAKSQIISQAATAMLAQANQQPQTVLSLLK